eukprot:14402969-Alexandrium_andersonii.AAC.2
MGRTSHAWRDCAKRIYSARAAFASSGARAAPAAASRYRGPDRPRAPPGTCPDGHARGGASGLSLIHI